MTEVWKEIPDSDNAYVSNLGNIKRNGRKVPFSVDTEGYFKCCVGNKIYDRVHRFVAAAFCENPNDYEYVDHIDNNKQNNKANNLRWCTAQENSKYAGESGLLSRTGEGKTWVLTIDDDNNGTIYFSQRDMSIETGIPDREIAKAICNKRNTCHGMRVVRLNNLKFGG